MAQRRLRARSLWRNRSVVRDEYVLGGKQVDVVSGLNAPTYSVARWYGKAVQHAAELEELSEAVLHALTCASRGGRAARRAPRFRYQVEVG